MDQSSAEVKMLLLNPVCVQVAVMSGIRNNAPLTAVISVSLGGGGQLNIYNTDITERL